MVGHLIELRVQLQPRGRIEGRGHTDLFQQPEAHSLAHVGWVRIICLEGSIANPSVITELSVRTEMAKRMFVIELKTVRLFQIAGGAVSTQFHFDIVVKFTIVE